MKQLFNNNNNTVIQPYLSQHNGQQCFKQKNFNGFYVQQMFLVSFRTWLKFTNSKSQVKDFQK